jgi:hemolysin activation/secretion protein
MPLPSSLHPLRGISALFCWCCLESLAVADSPPVAPPPSPAADANAEAGTDAGATDQGAEEPTLYVREYRVSGVKSLPQKDVEKAVYPFMGPRRTAADVEQARQALQKAFAAAGYEAVSVEVPPQEPRRGVIKMIVSENPVGRLRVHGSRYFSLEQIKRRVPSLAEGKVLKMDDVKRDIIALNQMPDRQVTPNLTPGVEPGTMDIDLTVKDKFPMHGSVELNNRYTADTEPLRLNASLSYANLWQLGHALGVSYQVAPQDPEDASVLSSYYLMRFPNFDDVSLMFMGTKQDSNVSTLGGAAVAGRGEILGLRALFNLPTDTGFYQSLSFGADYKHFKENVIVGTNEIATPITYYPISASYGANWSGKKSFTELNASATWSLRGTGSDEAEFDNKRYKANGAFFHVRGDVAHTHDLPLGLQVFGKVQGQGTGSPLINSEQFSAGGMGTVRGYLESTTLGDNGIAGSLELRSPSLLGKMNPKPEKEGDATRDPENEWRIYAFWDGARLSLLDPLPEQKDTFKLMSVGIGTHVKLKNHLNGSLDAGWPLVDQPNAKAGDVLLSFRVWADF